MPESRRSYSDLLKDPRWKARRKQIIARDRCCRVCFASGPLDVHHHFYVKDLRPWEYEDDQLSALCRPCHRHITAALFGLHDLLSRLPVARLATLVLYLESLVGPAPRWVPSEEPDDIALNELAQRESERLDLQRPCAGDGAP